MKRINPEIEKAVRGSKGLLEFCDQFGRDVYTQILLEVILEGVMNEEAVFVFGEQEQAGVEDDHGPTGGGEGGFETYGPNEPEATPDLGTPDLSNYP